MSHRLKGKHAFPLSFLLSLGTCVRKPVQASLLRTCLVMLRASAATFEVPSRTGPPARSQAVWALQEQVRGRYWNWVRTRRVRDKSARVTCLCLPGKQEVEGGAVGTAGEGRGSECFISVSSLGGPGISEKGSSSSSQGGRVPLHHPRSWPRVSASSLARAWFRLVSPLHCPASWWGCECDAPLVLGPSGFTGGRPSRLDPWLVQKWEFWAVHPGSSACRSRLFSTHGESRLACSSSGSAWGCVIRRRSVALLPVTAPCSGAALLSSGWFLLWNIHYEAHWNRVRVTGYLGAICENMWNMRGCVWMWEYVCPASAPCIL